MWRFWSFLQKSGIFATPFPRWCVPPPGQSIFGGGGTNGHSGLAQASDRFVGCRRVCCRRGGRRGAFDRGGVADHGASVSATGKSRAPTPSAVGRLPELAP